jgi:hypothetical protein
MSRGVKSAPRDLDNRLIGRLKSCPDAGISVITTYRFKTVTSNFTGIDFGG